MISLFEKYTLNKSVLILGFGREGKSTLRFIQKYFPRLIVGIADKDLSLDAKDCQGVDEENLFFGPDYLECICRFDVVIKSPGIRISDYKTKFIDKTWLSQSGLFLEQYHRQIIGVTGTKGKSTTSSIIFHILKNAKRKTMLVGNIGQPPFDLIEEIETGTFIVFELSANQLEYAETSPHVAVLLNLFPEHLDYFGSSERYFASKMKIALFQHEDDILVFDSGNQNIIERLAEAPLNSTLMPFQLLDEHAICSLPDDFLGKISTVNKNLKGRHNLKNIVAASMVCLLAGVSEEEIVIAIGTFLPLEHRLEFVGNFCGIDFINDSISTIPESTIEAVKTIHNIHTLILGGFDRGIEYGALLGFLVEKSVDRVIFTGPAGKRMMDDFMKIKGDRQQTIFVESIMTMSNLLKLTPTGKACVLSPAASSYDQFKDFEDRGRAFKKMAENLQAFCQ